MFSASNTGATFCPLIRKKCIQKKCVFWTRVIGKNPQNEETLDHWACAVSWIPMLLIENSQMSRQTGAATESMRNEIVKRMDSPRMLPREGNGREALPRV